MAVFKPIKKVSDKFLRKSRIFIKKCKKNIRKNDKNQKFILQKYKGIVYNLIGYTEKNKFKKKGKD